MSLVKLENNSNEDYSVAQTKSDNVTKYLPISSTSASRVVQQTSGSNNDDKNLLTIEQVIMSWFPQSDPSNSTIEFTVELDDDTDTLMSSQDEGMVFRCVHCPFESHNRLDVSKHTYKTHRHQGYLCQFCDKPFKQKINLDGHLLNKHHQIDNIESFVTNKIHYCACCNYRTINSFNLNRHLIVKHPAKWRKILGDVSVKRYECHSCKYVTINKGNFLTHSRVHTKEKLFKCSFCEKAFGQKYNMHLHLLRHHGDHLDKFKHYITSRVYECNFCNYKSLSEKPFVKHMTTCH